MAVLPAKYDANGKHICGAKNRQGNPCKNKPLPGKNRCKYHGGATPYSARMNAMKSGIYLKHFTEDEIKDYGNVILGGVDDEIRLCRVRLARALNAEAESKIIAAKVTELESMEITVDPKGLQTVKKVFKAQPFQQIIDRFVGRIESLEKTRAELIERSKNAAIGAGVDTSQIQGITISIQSSPPTLPLENEAT